MTVLLYNVVIGHYMIIKKSPSKINKKIVVISLIIAIVVLALICYIFVFATQKSNNINTIDSNDAPSNTIDYEPATKEQQEAGNQAKEDFINNTSEGEGSASSDVNITISSQSADKEAGIYRVRTIISTQDNSGSCTITLNTPEKDAIVQTVATQDLGTYLVCQGFDLNINTLGSSQWTGQISYEGSSGKVSAPLTIKL